MGFLRALLGRSKPAQPDLDALFRLPSAAVTLQATAGFTPSGSGSVSFRAAEGTAFAQTEQQVVELLTAGQGPEVEVRTDEYNYTWIVLGVEAGAAANGDISGLVTDLHAVNSTLESGGFGPSLLCSLVGFVDDRARSLALVYLYKRGTFYPFAPVGGQRRDNAVELQVAAALEQDLPIEQDKSRWFPVYGAPGL
ncbi:hypothetical protein RIF23_00050 [Lipingzhangella sp. LS1_29]|uniref:Uncharacterized protein n=1 Tax=Lipingzhangella rawalii TaxID=2055835 RepID=A0ABU2H034_9ACTN|nr:hypothetical protein [Lipingzhangella rawalii]MDS1268679.1 hypothetical protein [Lipingzhangella rawalii]